MRSGSLFAASGAVPGSVLGLLLSLLYLLASVYVYISLAYQISAKTREFFSGSRTIEQRMMIIVFAVAIAPVVEEFLFRFSIYGVLKRYFGRLLGVAFSALLFAAAHAHLPSLAPLFVLGSCFAIAYEWSGSILISMTMHSLFNSLTLTA